MSRPLILASSSPYRQQLLSRLGLPFEAASPALDETPLAEESPEALVLRLAETKARALAGRFPDARIIGSDQVAVLDGRMLGKAGDHERALAQLQACSGRRVQFLTGLCLLDSQTGLAQTVIEPFSVRFRALSDAQINTYLLREQPYDCAGSFKVEGLGIALFEALEGSDPNALIGLPLIRLIGLLAEAGVDVLAE